MNHSFLDKLHQLQTIDWILLGSFLFLFVLRLYYLLFFTGSHIFKTKKETISNEKTAQAISLFTTVRNEEENLKRILPQLLRINNIPFEVVVIDDYSFDSTYTILGQYRQNYNNFRFSSLNEEIRFSVKHAQNLALKAAQHDWVLLFPVECEELTYDWLSGFASGTATNNLNVLVGYTSLKAQPGLYNLLCRTELFLQQLKSAGFIANGLPFVYLEDNVAFKKQAYFNLGAYGAKTREPYANLELLINKFIREKHTAFLFNEQTRITKISDTGKEDYLNLLRKSVRIESNLSLWKRFLIAIEWWTEMIYLPFLVFVFIHFPDLWMLFLVPAGLKFITHLIIIKIAQNRLNERKIFIPSLIYGLLMPYFKIVYKWHFEKQRRKRYGRQRFNIIGKSTSGL
jgi:glycosyltransferase involved in cell wall biosynthesis